MNAQSHDAQLVVGLHELKRAYGVYDRAWFYFDPSKSGEPDGNTDLSYVKDVDKVQRILEHGIPDHPNASRKLLIFVSLYFLTSRTLETYREAWRLLYSRRDASAKDYSEDLRKAKRKGIRINDRDLEFAHVTTEELNEKVNTLIAHILKSVQADLKRSNWCAYEIEFGLLHERCSLLIDEISHINGKIDRLQDLFISNTQIHSARRSLNWAIVGIVASAVLAAASLLVSLLKSSSPTVVLSDEFGVVNSQLAIEIKELSGEIGNLRDKLTTAGAAEFDASKEITAAIQKLETAFSAESGPLYVQTKKALGDLDDRMEALLDAVTNGEPRAASLEYDDKLLREEVRGVRAAISDLRTVIEEWQPIQTTNEGDDNSKRAIIKIF